MGKMNTANSSKSYKDHCKGDNFSTNQKSKDAMSHPKPRDEKETGLHIIACSEMVKQLGQTGLLEVIDKYGGPGFEEQILARYTEKEIRTFGRKRDKMWKNCPYHAEMGGNFCGLPGCPMGYAQPNAIKRNYPLPGSIGVSANQIAIHTNSKRDTEEKEKCTLKLGKCQDGTQSIILQYEPQPRPPKPKPYKKDVNFQTENPSPPRISVKGGKGGKGKKKKK